MRPTPPGAGLPGSRCRVLFVGGKGGVGKTSVASATALARAHAGQRVLVVSTDPAHNLGHVWDADVGDEVVTVAEPAGGGRVDALEIDPAATVERHLSAVRGTMRRLLPDHLHRRADEHLALARDAPGTHESAVLERIAEAAELGLSHHDAVVFDTAPSGHTLRLMALPTQLTTWTETLLSNRDRSDRFGEALRGLGGGPAHDAADTRDAELRSVLTRRRERFAALAATVTDAEVTGFLLVLTADRLPVAETVELHRRLVGLGVPVAGLLVNRRSPGDAGELLAERRRSETTHLEALRRAVPQERVWEVPLLADDLVGEPGLTALAAHLVA